MSGSTQRSRSQCCLNVLWYKYKTILSTDKFDLPLYAEGHSEFLNRAALGRDSSVLLTPL